MISGRFLDKVARALSIFLCDGHFYVIIVEVWLAERMVWLAKIDHH